MNHVAEVDFSLPNTALIDADWADCYCVIPNRYYQTALEAAEAVVTAFPIWMAPLLTIRSLLVKPFGLKGENDVPAAAPKIGIFPIVEEETKQVVLGLNDKHLDFRVLVKLDGQNNGTQCVSVATLIKRHNLLGKTYLKAVLPFHIAIIKGALSRI